MVETKRRGRPPQNGVAQTGAERTRAYRERKSALAHEAPPYADTLLRLFAIHYRDHRRRDQVRVALYGLPLTMRVQLARMAADFAWHDAGFLLWDAYQSWHAKEPEAWPLPPADRIPVPSASPREKGRTGKSSRDEKT